jgi:hypothetical protein
MCYACLVQPSPTEKDIRDAIGAGCYAASYAKQTRGRLRRRKTAKRQLQLEAARTKCVAAAAPIRSFLGMVAWDKHKITLEQELEMKKVMEDLRYERRQITKML